MNLYWRPLIPNRGHTLGTALKRILERRRLNGVGGCITLTYDDVAYLRGIQDASDENCGDVKADAQILIDAIDRHGTVEIWIAE